MKLKFVNRFLLASAAMLMCSVVTSCSDEEPLYESLSTDVGADQTPETLRLVSYNILTGMDSDKANNYDNFVSWVNKMNPDVLALQECVGYTESFLTNLAARYSHPYVALMVNPKSNYPVAITSKYPIEVVSKMAEDTPLYHGAMHVKVKGINVVVLHLYPFSAAITLPSGESFASGDEYRTHEIGYILDNTFLKDVEDPNWIVCGDFNSYSVNDAAFVVDKNFDVSKRVLSSGLSDVVYESNSIFKPTTQGGSRIDFIYSSAALMRNAVRSTVEVDDFTQTASDHLPVIFDFRYVGDDK